MPIRSEPQSFGLHDRCPDAPDADVSESIPPPLHPNSVRLENSSKIQRANCDRARLSLLQARASEAHEPMCTSLIWFLRGGNAGSRPRLTRMRIQPSISAA